MVNFLEKLSGQRPDANEKRRSVAVRSQESKIALNNRSNESLSHNRGKNGRIPNASKVYAVAATILFVFASYFLFFKGILLTGILTLTLAVVLFGYAVFFMRFQN
jgi:Zn-dependent membrane protease YugP